MIFHSFPTTYLKRLNCKPAIMEKMEIIKKIKRKKDEKGMSFEKG